MSNGETLMHDRPRRKALLSKAEVFDDDGALGTARIRNLSEKGLGGVSDAPLIIDQRITLYLNGIGKVSGRVAWSEGGKFGVEFDSELNIDSTKVATSKILEKPQNFVVSERHKPTEDFKRPGFYHRGWEPPKPATS